MGEGDCMGESDLLRTLVGGIRRTSEGDLCRVTTDLRRLGESDLRRPRGDGDL